MGRRNQSRQYTTVTIAALMLTIAALMLASTALAQRTFRTIGTDLKHGFGDMWHVWSSPARADGGEWLTAAAVLGATAAISPVDDQLYRWMLSHPSAAAVEAIEPFREGKRPPLYHFGSGQRILPVGGGLYVVGFLLDSPALRDAALGCVTSYEAQSLVHELTYHVVSRTRPLASGGDQYDLEWGLGGWDYHSFYAGHAGNSMACATFLNERFRLGAAGPALYVLAIGVGLGRMADQRHWASDTMLGMVIGHTVGRAIGRRSRARAEARRGADAGAEATPEPGRGGLYLAPGRPGEMRFGWRREF